MKWNRRRGTVVDDQRTPVAGALVAVEWGTAPTPEIAIETERGGGFSIALPVEGRYRLRATAPGGESGSKEIDGAGTEEIVIVIEEDRLIQ
jgi:hypothetical protein